MGERSKMDVTGEQGEPQQHREPSEPRGIDLDAAVVLIAAAAAAGQTFRFEQVNPNETSSLSYARYEVYKKETTFAGLEVLRTLTFPGTKREMGLYVE